MAEGTVESILHSHESRTGAYLSGRLSVPIPEERLTAASPGMLLERFNLWHLEPVTWQRDATTLSRMVDAGRLKGYQLEWRGAPAAYCLVSGYGESVALMDVGINPATGTLTPGRILLQALSYLHWGKAMTISNVPADDPLNRVLAALLDSEITDLVEKHLRDRGVTLKLADKVRGFEGSDGSVTRVITEKETIEADLAIVAIGVRPNTALAKEAGLKLAQFGDIEVNEYLQTSDPDIYAGGDCAEGTYVAEQEILDLEREAFLSLMGETKTHERIMHMLTKGKPLRN